MQGGYYNMEAKDKLDKIYSRLDSYNPEPEDRADIIRNVMDITSESSSRTSLEKLMTVLFGWTEILWVRRGLVTISMGLIFVFVFQQFSIVSRIGRLESRMVESSTEKILKQQGEHVLLNSVIMKEIQEGQLQDSVMVSDKDLRDLIDSYSELQRRYQDLLKENYARQFNGNLKKQEL
jgi:hypothetical protein